MVCIEVVVSSLLEDLDELMYPYRCEFGKAMATADWFEWYKWMNQTYGASDWCIEKNVVWFKREEDMVLFILRWA